MFQVVMEAEYNFSFVHCSLFCHEFGLFQYNPCRARSNKLTLISLLVYLIDETLKGKKLRKKTTNKNNHNMLITK